MFHFEVFEWVKRGRGRPKLLNKPPRYKRKDGMPNGSPRNKPPSERELSMKGMFESGHTMEAIGAEYRISRERVRQLLKKYFGIVGMNGGYFVASTPKLIADAIETARRNEIRYTLKYAKHFFCSTEQFLAINGEHFTQSNRYGKKPAQAYFNQKSNAKMRGIEWKITFPEWWGLWLESGKYSLRGRGYGYCLARIGDSGAYQIGNVEIITGAQNSSDSYYRVTSEERIAKRRVTLLSK